MGDALPDENWAAEATVCMVEWIKSVCGEGRSMVEAQFDSDDGTTRDVHELRHPMAADFADDLFQGPWSVSPGTMSVFAEYVEPGRYVPALIATYASGITTEEDLHRFLGAYGRRSDPYVDLEACYTMADFGVPHDSDPFDYAESYRIANETWLDVFVGHMMRGMATPPGNPPIDAVYGNAWAESRTRSLKSGSRHSENTTVVVGGVK
jgi:hypothetical protein